jgi:hypothetical protein
MILITNVTTGVPIFNFSDSRLTATSYTPTATYTGASGGQGTTTIVLSYNTTSMSSGDKLQIMIDESNELMSPSETLMDPVGKLRVSMPQSLIDTDFEYGLQPTKWENIQLVNNRASGYFLPNLPYGVGAGTTAPTAINIATGMRAVTVNTAQPPAVGSLIQITNTSYAPADGFYSVDATSTVTSLAGVTIADTFGNFTCTSTTLVPGQLVTITGTLGGTGSITSYASGTVYRIGVTNGTTNFSLTTTAGAALTTTAGTPTGLTYTTTPAFTYLMRQPATSYTNIFTLGITLVFNGNTYTGAAIPTTSATASTTQNLSTVAITDAAGAFSCTAASPVLKVGDIVTISGIFGGTGSFVSPAYSNPTQYKISATNGTTTFTLQTLNGRALVTTAGTPTGLTYTVGTGITVTTTNPHGLHIGNNVIFRGWTAATSTPPNGTWIVTNVNSPTTFTVQSYFPSQGALTVGTVITRPEGVFYHRPFDGGVQYNTGSNFQGLQAFRQTRRYFRYQSGKGIQMSTNAILKPGFNVEQISSSTTTVTVTTKIPHTFIVGLSVTVSGCTPTSFNGTFTVTSVLDQYRFTYTSTSYTGTITAGVPYVVVNSWYNSIIRCGMFDSQNGFFYEFDGQNLYACRRSSTQQISGTVAVTQNSSTVTGTNTYFSKQLVPGDFIVIRGLTYRVSTITSDTALTILPEYRGASVSGVVISRTVDTRIVQTTFNIDPVNGTGPSGYTIDLTKSQMLYMDYSWYGAGAIRFGFRDIKGEIIYVHRFTNNNVQTEAYMRSGNLPARYETNTIGVYTSLTATLAASGTTATVADTSLFPPSGTIMIQNPAGTAYEYANYTGKTATTFTGLTRGITTSSPATVVTTSGSVTITGASLTTAAVQPGMFVLGPGIPDGTFIISVATGVSAVLSQAATASGTVTITVLAMGAVNPTHTFSATAPIAVYGHTPQFSPLISHWGSSVVMDGGFDDDKSFVFTTGMTSPISVGTANTNALMSLRIAPSVDNGITSTLGLREIVNRMQLTLRSVGVRSDGNFLVQLYLNAVLGGATNSFGQPTNNPSSLGQIVIHPATTTVTGGEVIYAFYTDGSGGGSYSTTAQDITLIRDLGNSVIGGGTNNFANSSGQSYPDGPDVLTVVVTNLEGAARNATARIAWTEAQA